MIQLVAVYILPKQCNLLESLIPQIAHFAEDALHIAASLSSAGIGYYAVVAEIIAAAHDTDESSYLVADADTLRNHVLIGLGGG